MTEHQASTVGLTEPATRSPQAPATPPGPPGLPRDTHHPTHACFGVLVYAAGAGGEGGAAAVTDIDGTGLTTAIEAARLAGVHRLLLVSVFPDAWHDREVSDDFEHHAVRRQIRN